MTDYAAIVHRSLAGLCLAVGASSDAARRPPPLASYPSDVQAALDELGDVIRKGQDALVKGARKAP